MNFKKFIKNLLWIDDQLTVGQKLTIGSIVLSILILAVGTAGLYSLGKIEGHLIAEQLAGGGHVDYELMTHLDWYEKFLAFLTFTGVATALLFGYRIRKRIIKPPWGSSAIRALKLGKVTFLPSLRSEAATKFLRLPVPSTR